MSTDYVLLCEDCKELVYMARNSLGGYGPMTDYDLCGIPFIIAHSGCHVEIISEHDDRSWPDEYTRWEEGTVDEMVAKSRARGTWGRYYRDELRDHDYKARTQILEQESAVLQRLLQAETDKYQMMKSSYYKLKGALK